MEKGVTWTLKKELSPDEDDFDGGLEMHVWNHTSMFPHRKEGICAVCSAYIHLKRRLRKISVMHTTHPKMH